MRAADGSTGPTKERNGVRPRALMLASVIAVAASLLAAGCGGGGGSPEVASVASSTTSATTPPSGAVAFARCMRSHGVPGFPDPSGGGAFDGSAIKHLVVGRSQMRAAQSACIHLLPNGIVPTAPGYTITRADRIDYLKAAACMRRHGIPDFPDPTFPSNGVKFTIPSSIDQNSPRVRSALPVCRKLIPAGLPYSGTS